MNCNLNSLLPLLILLLLLGALGTSNNCCQDSGLFGAGNNGCGCAC